MPLNLFLQVHTSDQWHSTTTCDGDPQLGQGTLMLGDGQPLRLALIDKPQPTEHTGIEVDEPQVEVNVPVTSFLRWIVVGDNGQYWRRYRPQ